MTTVRQSEFGSFSLSSGTFQSLQTFGSSFNSDRMYFSVTDTERNLYSVFQLYYSQSHSQSHSQSRSQSQPQHQSLSSPRPAPAPFNGTGTVLSTINVTTGNLSFSPFIWQTSGPLYASWDPITGLLFQVPISPLFSLLTLIKTPSP